MSALSVIFIDNFDSFTFNLVDELDKRGAQVQVWRNDIAPDRALELLLALAPPRLAMISPGPGTPADAGCSIELVRLAAQNGIPLCGVCLGHQAIVEAFGGEVGFAGEVVHGKAVPIEHDSSGPFAGLPSPMLVGRYHSLAARRVPSALRVTARAGEIVMAVAHVSAPVFGFQFHPESILTPRGGLLMEGVIDWATRWA